MKLRHAILDDAETITNLVNYWFRQTGDVLPRTLEDVCESIRTWVVAEDERGLLGCGSLIVLGPDLAEIRSLVVRPDHRGNGVGGQIVGQLLADAETLGGPTVFTLTKAPGFFTRLGFEVTKKENFPRKVWRDCIHCSKFPACDEIAMLYTGESVRDEQPTNSGAVVGTDIAAFRSGSQLAAE
jgi:amino-acid N-acetyltransferase